MVVQGQAGGNAVEIVTFDDTHVTSTQDGESANIGSDVNAGVSNVGGSVSVSDQAVCNSTDVSTDPNITAVNSNQNCNAQDPGSSINATVHNIGGDVSIASARSATHSPKTPTRSARRPRSTRSIRPASSRPPTPPSIVGGSVGVTSSAIGNNAQIVHYSTGP